MTTTYSFAAWERTKALTGRNGLGKIWTFADKLSSPTSSRRSSKPGPETFWPTSLDQESHKAARILRSFCEDGFYDEEVSSTPEGPQLKRRAIKKVPSSVIAGAQGLAIFTVMRGGLWNSGGSGILIARRPDGGWSAPSAILLHSAALEFLIGTDIYDCLVIANTRSALEVLRSTRCTLVPEVGAMVGPVTEDGESLEGPGVDRPPPAMWTYLKTRGYCVDISIDGAVITERTDENERFYGERLSVGDILARKPRPSPREIKVLMETVKVAQADKDADRSMLSTELAPGDVAFEKPDHVFGVPDGDDPDPYGFHALGLEGVEIREAGSRSRPSSEQFEYRPSPTSPVYQTFRHRRSTSSLSGRTRESYSRRSVDRFTQMVDTATQTPDSSMDDLREVDEQQLPDETSNGGRPKTMLEDDDFEHGLTDEPVEIHEEVQAQAAPQIISKARLITIPKKLPPALPVRSPARRKIVVNGQPAVNGVAAQNGLGTPSASPVSEGCGTDGDLPSPPKALQHRHSALSTPPTSPEVGSISSVLAGYETPPTSGVHDGESEPVNGSISTKGSSESNGQRESTNDVQFPLSPQSPSTEETLPAAVAPQPDKPAATA